jgi:hypothetical protein
MPDTKKKSGGSKKLGRQQRKPSGQAYNDERRLRNKRSRERRRLGGMSGFSRVQRRAHDPRVQARKQQAAARMLAVLVEQESYPIPPPGDRT